MRYLRLAVLPLVLAACSERAPTEPVVDGPAFNWTNNPDVGNLKVYRSEYAFATCWTDPATGLRACHATRPLSGGDPDCGLQSRTDPVDWQEVVIDPDNFRVIGNAMGDVFITIRDMNTVGACFGNDLVAEGWGTLHRNDNDEYGTVVNNTNTFGTRAQGALTTPGGDKVQYSGHTRYAFSADKSLRLLSLQVVLH